jgi:hypothetical protein
MHKWAQCAKHLAGIERAGGPPAAVKGADGALRTGAQVLPAFTEHFKGVLGQHVPITAEADGVIAAAEAARHNQLAAARFVQDLEDDGQLPAPDPDPDPAATAAAAATPTLAEVDSVLGAMRNNASPGADRLEPRLLKQPAVSRWLHRVVSAAWDSGVIPSQWRAAEVAVLYKGKGARDDPNSYRGISLLSIAGKVFAAIILHRVMQQLEAGEAVSLHESQCGLRKGRGTPDALFVLRAVGGACKEHRAGFAKAYVDFSKAFDCVNRDALWRILAVYGVHPKLITLLKALHTDSTAAVRIAGQVGSSFATTSGVRQGCVIAPALFNIFLDFVVRKALREMPADCGVHLRVRSAFGGGSDPARSSLERIVMLLYADDLVLMSHSLSELRLMLLTLDRVAAEFGLHINAAKTEIHVDTPGGNVDVAPVQLLSGQVPIVTGGAFKYLGSWEDAEGIGKEILARRGRVLGTFKSFANIWSNKKLRVRDKMAVYNTFILPHFWYGSETWAYAQGQVQALEVAHNDCLREILGVRRIDRHPIEHIHTRCGSGPIELTIARRSLRWLGHVFRMGEERYPRRVLDCIPDPDFCEGRGPGRPPDGLRHTYGRLLTRVGVESGSTSPPPAPLASSWQQGWEWLLGAGADQAQDRPAWRARLTKLTMKVAPTTTTAPPRRSTRRHTQ